MSKILDDRDSTWVIGEEEFGLGDDIAWILKHKNRKKSHSTLIAHLKQNLHIEATLIIWWIATALGCGGGVTEDPWFVGVASALGPLGKEDASLIGHCKCGLGWQQLIIPLFVVGWIFPIFFFSFS